MIRLVEVVDCLRCAMARLKCDVEDGGSRNKEVVVKSGGSCNVKLRPLTPVGEGPTGSITRHLRSHGNPDLGYFGRRYSFGSSAVQMSCRVTLGTAICLDPQSKLPMSPFRHAHGLLPIRGCITMPIAVSICWARKHVTCRQTCLHCRPCCCR